MKRFHSFTINDNDRPGGQHGSLARAGRWIVHRSGKHALLFSVEWSFFDHSRSADAELIFDVRDGSRVQLHLALPWLFTVYFSIGVPRRWLQPWMMDERRFGIRIGYIGDLAWILIAHDEWGEDMRSYYQRKIDCSEECLFRGVQLWQGPIIKLRLPLRDWLFGRTVYADRVIKGPVECSVSLDGREYPARWTLHESTWKRPRLPFVSRRVISSTLKLEYPPAFSGKGESAWDCGDDGIFSRSGKETTMAGAIGAYVTAVLERRQRYGKPADPDAFQERAVA